MTNYEEYFAEGVGSFHRSMMLKESDGGTAQRVLLNEYCPVGTAQRVLSNGYYSSTQWALLTLFSIFVNLAIKTPFTGAELL